MMYFEIAVSLLLLWILYRFINLCRVQMATGGFSKITDRRSLESTSSCVPTSTSKKSVTEDWSSVRWSCGLNNDTVKERKGCKSPVLASTEDDLTSVGHCRRRLLHNSLEGTRNKDKLTARYGNMKLAAELLQAFPRDRYEVEDHCLEEEGGSEDIEAVTVSTTDNLQDQILIYCKPYIVALKTGTLEFDETGDFVGEAMEIVDAGNYKGALLLLPEQTFLPRYLAEKLQQKGDIRTLRHTDGFVRDVREEVDKLLKDEDDENDEEEHDEPERTTPSGKVYLLEVSPGEQVLMAGDEDRHGRDKEDPRTPVPLTETRKPGARPKVNRKLYPELPAQDGSQDTRATGSSKGKRETGPGDGIRDVRSNAGKQASNQSPSRSPQIYVSPSSRHSKKDPSPDERSDETSASKASSGVSSGVHVRKDGALDIRFKENKIAAGLDGSKIDDAPDLRFEENKQTYDMSWSASDFEHPTPMETESVLEYPTPMEIENTPFQRDDLADNTASSPNVPIDDGHVRLFTSNFRGSSYAGQANRLPNPPASACLPAHLSINRQENTNRGLSSYSPRYLPVCSPSYSPCYSPGYSPSPSSAPPKKDGSPDMRYKENKIAAGLHGYKKDGTPDRRLKANRR